MKCNILTWSIAFFVSYRFRDFINLEEIPKSKKMNRRNWLRLASLSGGALALNPLNALDYSDAHHHPLDNPNEDLVRLCYNENPYGPSDHMKKKIMESLEVSHMYPFNYYDSLGDRLAAQLGVSRDHIVLTSGSREGLKSTALTFSEPGDNFVAPYPTYKALLTYAEQQGTHIFSVPLTKDFKHDFDGMSRRMTNRTNLVFVCNPNNPTGTIMQADHVRDFTKAASDRTMVFVDEAYVDYVDEDGYESMIDLVKEDRNVILSRTFSKIYGLAGIRIGYLVARPDIASMIRDNLMASPSTTAIYAGNAALDDREFYNFSLGKNKECKEIIYEVCKMKGLEYLPSNANFVFFKTGMDINDFNEKMRAQNVLVGRPFPPNLDWCRISTGKVSEVERFAEVLQKVM